MINTLFLLARKYAQAYYQTLGHSFTYEDYEHVRIFERFISSRERSLVLLSVPALTDHEKREALERLSDLYALPVSLHALWALLVAHKRIFLIPHCLKELAMLFEQAHGIERFVIMSSHELDEEGLALIKAYLGDATKKTIKETVVIDKRLVAGIRLQSNNHIWEYSVRKQLRALQTLLVNKGSYGD